MPADLAGRASVIDGDTIEVHGTRIRLWGIDAPESTQPCRSDDSEQ
jgi:endonuclease YncB( thermonuclease family)